MSASRRAGTPLRRRARRVTFLKSAFLKSKRPDIFATANHQFRRDRDSSRKEIDATNNNAWRLLARPRRAGSGLIQSSLTRKKQEIRARCPEGMRAIEQKRQGKGWTVTR